MYDAAGFDWHHLPIAEACAPCHSFEKIWNSVSHSFQQLLNDGGRVLIHGKNGLGRTGTVAAKLLIERGVSPQEAIHAVRGARGEKSIQAKAQLDYLLSL